MGMKPTAITAPSKPPATHAKGFFMRPGTPRHVDAKARHLSYIHPEAQSRSESEHFQGEAKRAA